MKKTYIFLILSVLAFPFRGEAAFDTITSLPHSASAVSCADFDQGLIPPNPDPYEGTTNCEKVNTYGTWYTDSAHGFKITSAANYPGGAGGKGFRQWYGDSNNSGSGMADFRFNPRPTELWIRYYARWEAGFNAANTGGATGLWQKMLYLYNTSSVPSIAFSSLRGSGCEMQSYGTTGNFDDYGSGCGATQLGFDPVTQLSNGQWQLIEWHFKIANPAILEFYINGTKAWEKLGWNATAAGWTGIGRILVPSNNHTLNNGRVMYYDQDDFAFSTTGRIGPYVGGIISSPPPPTPTPAPPAPPAIQSIQ
ncbi:MAG: hypothetical protein WC899_01085 [bacterium]